MYTATLRCGTVLEYEAPGFVPHPGEMVPCRRHGYCVSESAGRVEGSQHGFPRARSRAQHELLEWLQHRPETTIHALRRQRFTLRLIAAAEREGHLEVDLDTGRVSARSRRPRVLTGGRHA